MKQSYTVGALNRSSFRRALQGAGIQYQEDKGFLDSFFTVEATLAQHQKIIAHIEAINYQAAFTDQTYKIWNGGGANEFEDYARKVVNAADIEVKKGWFKTKLTINCHKDQHKKFEEFIKNL